MDAPVAPLDRMVDVRGLRLHVREWPGSKRPFVLVHGLASNARTWDAVARHLHREGHRVVAVDQRGHGMSDKPATGFGFDDVTADLEALLPALGLRRPLLAGQSWGGNVALEFAARYPDAVAGLAFIDGGYIELSSAPGATWERVSIDLRPPDLAGRPRREIAAHLRSAHPDWTGEGIEATLANFETLPDGTVRPWLSLDRHMEILRALWEHQPSAIYSRVKAPALLAIAGRPDERSPKHQAVGRAPAALRAVRVRWFEDADHDIHVHRPEELAGWLLEAVGEGFFGPP